MKPAIKLEITCTAIAVLLGVGLMAFLTSDGDQLHVDPRAPLPGAGWGWSFDYDLGMQGLGNRQPSNTTRRPGSRTDLLELALNKPFPIGDIEITYRGLAPKKRFQIDLVIPVVDPQYSYSHEFSIADARKGFTLMDRRFKLVGAGRTVLRLRSDPASRP